MATASSFALRLEAVRQADEKLHVKSPSAYMNGQIPVSDSDMSQWDNFDRYFKFYNIASE